MTDPRESYERALAQTGTIIEATRPDQLDLTTPCDSWDVRTLLTHLVGVADKVAALGEGENVLDRPSFSDIGFDWAASYRAAAARSLEAWEDDSKLETLYAVPWGKVPGGVALAGFTQEMLTHGWDLAVATGQPSELDPALATFALDLMRKVLPTSGREATPFGPSVPAPEGAGPYAQLAAWLGRTPPA